MLSCFTVVSKCSSICFTDSILSLFTSLLVVLESEFVVVFDDVDDFFFGYLGCVFWC